MSVHVPETEDVTPPQGFIQHPIFSGVTSLPPSVNGAYKIIRTIDGMRLGPTPALEQFKQETALLLAQAKADWPVIEAIRESKYKVPLKVVCHVYFNTEWRRDLDGVIKYAIDAVFERMGLDDRLMTTLIATKHVDKAQPRIEIEIFHDLSSR